MELIKFVLSDFWIFWGFLILVNCISIFLIIILKILIRSFLNKYTTKTYLFDKKKPAYNVTVLAWSEDWNSPMCGYCLRDGTFLTYPTVKGFSKPTHWMYLPKFKK